MTSRVLALLALVAVASSSASAQQMATPRFQAWAPEQLPVTRAPLAQPVPAVRRDYRYEGMLIGAVLFGALGAWIGTEACHSRPEPLGGAAGSQCTRDAFVVGGVGALVGAGLGYLLGRGVLKRSVRVLDSFAVLGGAA